MDDALGLTSSYSISARTRFEEHYSTAINLYKNNNPSGAILELGRALHYLQDVSATPHSAGLVSKGDIIILDKYNYHAFYENWAAAAYSDNNPNVSQYIATSASAYYSQILNYENPSIALNEVARISYQFKDVLTQVTGETPPVNYAPFEEVGRTCIRYAQQISAAIMNRFYEDVTNPGRYPHYIKDGGIYYIRNKKTNEYWDMESWGSGAGTQLQYYSFHGDTNQQFRAIMQSDGSFCFSPVNAENSSYVINMYERHDNVMGFHLKASGTKMKPVYQQDGTYRIMPCSGTNKNKYEDVIYPQNDIADNYLSTASWAPSNESHQWYFDEVVEYSSGVEVEIAKYESKKIIYNCSITNNYIFTTEGNTDTYFVALHNREGTGKSSRYNLCISEPNDDGGEGNNARYNQKLTWGQQYILDMKLYGSGQGKTTISIRSFTPDPLEKSKQIRGDVKYTITDDGRFTNDYDSFSFTGVTGYSLSTLKNMGYSGLSIKVTLTAYEEDDGYQYVFLYDGSGESANHLGEVQFEHVPGKKGTSPETHAVWFYASLANITTETLYLRYGASGGLQDDWVNYNVIVTIYLT